MKLRLRVLDGSLEGQEFELVSGHLLIGRSQNCSVRFDPFRENIVSSQHAFVYSGADGFYVRDNSSTNGTYLNGEMINKAKLSDGDTIAFGRDGVKAAVFIDDLTDSVETLLREPSSSDLPLTEPGPTRDVPEAVSLVEQRQQPKGFNQTLTGVGLSAQEAMLPPPQTAMYIAIAIMSGLILLASLPVFLLIVVGLGPIATVVATIAAFFPVALYLAPMLWLDRYDPEPFWLLLLCFAWGAVVAVLTAAVVNDIVSSVTAAQSNSEKLGMLVGAVLSAPFVEESMKGLGLLAMLLFFRRHFDDVLDGIVFGGVIALGFATVENVLYYGREFLTGGIVGLGVVFALRGILSPFAHVTFTAMTGIGCGLSRASYNWFVRLIAPALGLAAAIFLHMVWNGMSLVVLILLQWTGTIGYCSEVGLGGENVGTCAFLVGYAALEVPVFFIFVAFSLFIMRRQSRTLREMLAIDVARGLIPQEHLDIATSMFKSIFWSLGGILKGKFLNRRRYLRAIGSLGLSYWHIQKATAAQGHTASFQQNPFIRAEVEKYGKLV